MPGYNTKQKNELIAFLENNPDTQFSASQIAESLSGVGKSTVFRRIKELCDEGILRRLMGDDGKSVLYQYADRVRGCDRHFHIKCVKCGKILHLDCSEMDKITEHIKNEHGFTVISGKSMLYGVCKECGR